MKQPTLNIKVSFLLSSGFNEFQVENEIRELLRAGNQCRGAIGGSGSGFNEREIDVDDVTDPTVQTEIEALLQRHGARDYAITKTVGRYCWQEDLEEECQEESL